MVTAVESNPLAILTFIAAPAILTNASSLLALGTSNRFARMADRTRQIMKFLETEPAGSQLAAMYRGLLDRIERRCTLMVRALALFYFAVGCFAGGSLMSLLGAILASPDHPLLLRAMMTVALLAGGGGLSGLVVGGWLLVTETRLALATIREEVNFQRGRIKEG
jgi:hypothetical protein